MAGAGRSDELIQGILRILESTREGRQHPAQVERMIDEAHAAAAGLAERLEQLQGFVVLEEASAETNDMADARAAWGALDADVDIRDVDALVDVSPTLSALHRAAMTVRSVHRFSEARLQLAERLGRESAACGRYYSRLATGGPLTLASSAPDPMARADSMERVLRALEQAGAASGFELRASMENAQGKKYSLSRKEVRNSGAVKSWFVKPGQVEPGFKQFLAGDWLSAFAYRIAHDQFERTKAPFEIYSKVVYQLPGDLGGGSSDVDVLVRTAQVVLSIECKAGLVLRFQPSAAQKTRKNAERFDRILDQMGVELRRLYQLVYLESADEPKQAVVDAVVGPVDLQVLVPQDVRPTLQAITNDDAPRRGRHAVH